MQVDPCGQSTCIMMVLALYLSRSYPITSMTKTPEFARRYAAWEKRQKALDDERKLRAAGKHSEADRKRVENFGIGSLLA